MSASAVGALTRASWYQARSYRLSLFMQVAGILLTVVPIYFIAHALQTTMVGAIARESDQYFSFVLAGSVGLMFVTAAMTVLPGSIAGGISTGYFEALLMTRAPVPWVLAGLSSYGLLLTFTRVTFMLIAGWALGANLAWSQIGPAAIVLALLVLAHWGIGLVASALVIAFRTAGPLTQIFTTLSMFFGGVYYPVSAIPSWLGAIAKLTPLAYGLKSFRRVLIQGESLAAVGPDLVILAGMGAIALAAGAFSIRLALRYARKAGTLGMY